jgi:hypothetical protein
MMSALPFRSFRGYAQYYEFGDIVLMPFPFTNQLASKAVLF